MMIEQYSYDYYHAGRLLHLMGSFHSAGIMLGYTVETIMKAGLVLVLTKEEQKKNKILNRDHDIRKIFEECKRHKLFMDVQVSQDFLEHINYHFQRYPSQAKKALIEASSKRHVIGNSTDWIYYYDDLIVQLDYFLFKKTKAPSKSIIYKALSSLETQYSRDILRENPFAFLKFDEYRNLIYQKLPEREDLKKMFVENLSKGALFYWNTNLNIKITQEDITAIANKYSVKTFKIPKWTTSNGFETTII